MADIASWSPIDDNNNAAPPDGWPEGQMPSTANNCARAMMGGVRRWYDTVTAQIASLTASLGNYLPLGGGHLTGPVTSASSFAASGNLSGWDITAGGTVASTNISAAGTITGGYVHSTGDVHADNALGAPTITATTMTATGAVTGGSLVSNTSLVANSMHSLGTVTVDGVLTAGYVHSTGDIHADNALGATTMTATGAVTGNYVHSTGHIDSDTYVYAPDGFWAHDAAGGTTYRMYSSGGASYLQFANLYAFQWSAASGALNYIASGDIQWVMRTGDFLTYNALAPVGGLGAYINLSDRRGKIDIVPSTKGLDEILGLSPVEFQRVSRVSGQTGMDRRELGFIAQDVQGVLPEAVRVVGMALPDGTGGLEDAEPSLGLTDSTIVAVLVNAMKELNARLVTLEHRGDAA